MRFTGKFFLSLNILRKLKVELPMKIAIASDAVGAKLKPEIKAYLKSQGHEVKDFGTCNEKGGGNFSEFVIPAIFAVAKGECERGIFVDGERIFSAYTANRIYRLYTAICQDPFYFQFSREHTEYDILCINSTIGKKIVMEVVEIWMGTTH